MEPDGALFVTVREIQLTPDGSEERERTRTYRYDFKDIRSWRREPWGILVLAKNNDATGYPWNMIEQYVCKPNNDEYVAWYREQNG